MYKKFLSITLIVSIPFLILFMLGTWQLFRLNWKNNIIAKMDMSPIELVTQTKNINDFAYRKVIVEGVLSKFELYVFAGAKGYYALTPMLLDGGEYILVNKGVISKEQKRANTELKVKRTTVNGILYCDSHKNINKFITNNSKDNVWPWLDVKAISDGTEIKFNPCILWATDKLDDSILLTTLPKPRNYHLQYMITWYALAFAWLIICYLKNRDIKS